MSKTETLKKRWARRVHSRRYGTRPCWIFLTLAGMFVLLYLVGSGERTTYLWVALIWAQAALLYFERAGFGELLRDWEPAGSDKT